MFKLTSILILLTFLPNLIFSQIIYQNVSATNLPLSSLNGSSMDAKPADVDGDGDLDIFIACEFCPNKLLINDGNGFFTNESISRIPQIVNDSEDIAVADFDGDNDIDVFFVSEDDSLNEFYLNDGNGFFTNANNLIPVNGKSNATLAIDIEEDGDFDILIGNDGQNVILINDGNGNFTNETSQRLPPNGNITQDLEFDDVDGDGDKDLLEGNENGNRLLLNDGNGFFTEVTNQLAFTPIGEETREVEFGDVDGDNDLDIFFANVTFLQGKPSQNRLLLNDGNGFFTDETIVNLPIEGKNTVDGDFVDIDLDGDLDLVLSNSFNASFQILENDGNGDFKEATNTFIPTQQPIGDLIDAEFADFNGDGLNDLYLCGFGQSDYLYFGVDLANPIEEISTPKTFSLSQNFPNPFNPNTVINYQLSLKSKGKLTIFNVLGKKVKEFVLNKPKGSVTWNGKNDFGNQVATGIYFYRIESVEGFSELRKMLLLK